VTGDASTARVGDCFIDVGTPQAPAMQKVVCASGTLQVLRRFDGTSDLGHCNATETPGWTNSFSYKYNNNEATSFVLCLKRR
jgi:hypothetical protein